MSLILDALRKSEAERRRGQAPDLFASAPAAPTARPIDLRRAGPWLVLLALSVAAGLVLWLGHGQPSPDTAGKLQSDPAHLDQARPQPPAMLPVPSLPTPAVTAPATVPPTAVALPEPSPATTATAAAAAPPARSPALATPDPAQQSPVPMAAMPLPEPAAPAAADEGGQALPTLAVLEASERSALPPLKLSMHVWASEPGKRFAIVDGQRVTEGSTLGVSIVEQIRRDGVVLNINGRRVLLPRP